jgi:uncharacterized protein YukE
MREDALTDLRDECEQAVVAAALEEREAHTALTEGVTPLHPSWCEHDEDAHAERLTRWQAAARALVEALDRLEARRTSKEGGYDQSNRERVRV